MESGKRWKDEDIPKTQWDLRSSCGCPRRSCTGSSGSSTSTTCSSCAGRASAAGRTSTPTRCTSRRSSSSMRRSGRASPTGPTSSRRIIDQATPDARRRSLPVHAHRRRPRSCSRSRPRWATARRTTRRRSASTSASPASRPTTRTSAASGRAAPAASRCGNCNIGCGHNAKNKLTTNYLYLAEKLGAEVHELHEVHELDAARRRRVRGARASPRLGAARGAPAPSHVHRRAGDRRRPRVRLGEAPAPHAAQGPPAGPLRASSASARGRTPSSCSLITRTLRRVEARSREAPHHARVGVDHLRRLARPGDEHRARLSTGVGSDLLRSWSTYHQHGEQKHATRRWLKELVEHPGKVLGFDRRPPLVGADGDHALHADDRHVDRAVLARRHAAQPAGSGTPPSVHIPVVEDFADRSRRRWTPSERALPFEAINRTASAHFIGGIPIGDSTENGAVDPYLRPVRAAGPARHGRQRDAGQPGREPVAARSPPWPSGRCRCGRTRATPTPGRRSAPATSASTPVMPHQPIVPAGAPGELRLDAKKADVIPEYPY